MARREQRYELTFAVLAVAVGSFTLLQSMVIPVLGLLQVELGTDASTITWVLTAYLVSASVFTPIAGRIGDVVGKRKVMVLTLLALALGSVMAAVATHVGWLIVARVVQGLGGGVLPLAFGIIRDEFPPAKMPSGLSVVASLASAGFGIGIVIAGPIVDVLGYHWLFWLPAIATGVAAVAAFALVPESPRRQTGRIPILPALLLSCWLTALLLACTQGNGWGWSSIRILTLFGVALLTAALWITVESRISVPLIDLRMLRRRALWTTNVVTAFHGFAVYACLAFLPQLVQAPQNTGYGLGATTTQASHLIFPFAVAGFVMGFGSGPLIRSLGGRLSLALGMVTIAASLGLLVVWHASASEIATATTILGLGAALSASSAAAVIVASVPACQTGAANGMNANIRTVGGAVGSALMAGVVTAHIGVDGIPLEDGYVRGFIVLASGMLLATVVACLAPNVRINGNPQL